MWWGHSGCVFFPFFLLFFVVLGFTIIRFFMFRTCGFYAYRHTHSHYESKAILKRRLANGEITEAEYRHLQEILKQ